MDSVDNVFEELFVGNNPDIVQAVMIISLIGIFLLLRRSRKVVFGIIGLWLVFVLILLITGGRLLDSMYLGKSVVAGFNFAIGFILVIGVFGMVIGGIESFLSRLGNKNCQFCTEPWIDRVWIEDSKKENLCRRHSVEIFKQSFGEFLYPLVVFHPELDRKYCRGMYPFYPIDEFVSKFNIKKEGQENMERVVSQITGNCEDCKNRPASVVYFKKGEMEFDGTGPLIEKVSTRGQMLCKNCTLERIVPDISKHPYPLDDNGLYLPYDGSGVYVNTFI